MEGRWTEDGERMEGCWGEARELGGRMGSAFTPEGLEDFYLTTSRRKLQERVVGGASGRVCVPWASRCGSFCAAACEMTLTSGLATCGFDSSRWELGAPSFQFVNDVLGSAAVQSEMESGELLRVVEAVACPAGSPGAVHPAKAAG